MRNGRVAPERALDALKFSHVPKSYHKKLHNMLRDVNTIWDFLLGEINTTKHQIDFIPSARPVIQPPTGQVQNLGNKSSPKQRRCSGSDVTEPAQSPWPSPVVPALKYNGTSKFCVEHRWLNAVTVRDTHPIPRKDECIEYLGDATVFTALDANWVYWQVPVRQEYREKTAFSCHAGTNRFKRMSCGLSYAIATFQRQ